MIVSYRLLKEYVDLQGLSLKEVCDALTLAGFELEGIETLEDLKSLEGGFLLDKGFVSTSLVEDSCYYRKPNELGLNYNVKIEYLVPEEFEDGVSIGNVSYCPGQNEYFVFSLKEFGNLKTCVAIILIPQLEIVFLLVKVVLLLLCGLIRQKPRRLLQVLRRLSFVPYLPQQ